MTEVIVDNEYITLTYDPDAQIVAHIVHQNVQGEPLHEALNIGIEVMRQAGACKWLADDRKNNGMTPDDINWSMASWGPRAVSAGWKYWALVVPDTTQGRADMTEVVESHLDLGVSIRVFLNTEEARNWLIKL